jgi:GNAT superfamily N-acetyltransferase
VSDVRVRGATVDELRHWEPEIRREGVSFVRNGIYFAAIIDGEIAGFCAVAWRGKDAATFRSHWVRPEYRGRGIGSLLLQHSIETTRASGRKYLRANCTPPAVSVFARHGGIVTKRYAATGLTGMEIAL